MRVSRRTDQALLVASAAGTAGVAAAFFHAGSERFWANWIIWFLFLLTASLGCLFIVALEHTVGARWSVPLRRVPERLSSLLLPLTPVALAALFSLPKLYPWVNPEVLENPIISGKAPWLNLPFFSLRVVICLTLWLISYRVLVIGSLRQDRSQDPAFNLRARRFSPLFMVIFGITVTLVAFDWISSLEPEWYSDIFGVYIFAGSFLAGLAATTLAVLGLKAQGFLKKLGPDHLYNLGAFMFAFTVFWSYIGFAQYMLMWYANIPEEVFWYKERLQGGWGVLLLSLAVLHFLIPFFILIPRESKSNPKLLSVVATILLASHWLDLYWMIFPVFAHTPLFGWPEISFTLMFLGGTGLWLRRSMKRGEDMPVGDPLLREGLEFRL